MQKIIPLFFLCTTTALAADNEVKELDTMVVSASLPTTSSTLAKPVTVLTGDALHTKMGSTIGETLKNELGVTSQSFGAGVGSPVIRGQSGPRVQVMQNSMSNNDVSSLSPDHANGVEPILAERIEVLRGPATLLYGNGAIGGIVNVLDNRIPEQEFEKVIGGAGEQRYDSATNETSSVVKVEGSKNGFAYHVDGFYRDQGNTHIGGRPIDGDAVRINDPSFVAIDNPQGVINNSNARSRGGSVGVSMIGETGLVGASINQLEKNYGIPSDGTGEAPVTVDLKQTKYDFKAQLNQPFAFAEKLKMKFGYTDYQHTELDGGQPATHFLNKSYASRLELEQRPIGALTGTLGFQSTNTEFSAINADGSAPLVPKSNIDSYGLFAVESYKHGAVTYELGGRGEWVTISPENINSLTYLPISGSMSALWEVNKQHQLSLAYTHSQRAPLIQELFYDGVHEASRSYELGNANLGKEFSNNLDLAYRFNSDWMNAEVNVFHNWVSNYIYQQRADYLFNTDAGDFTDACALDEPCIPVEISQQAGATFKGYEAQLKFPIMENNYGLVDLSLFSDYTRGTFNKGGDVPRMPPLRYGLQLSYEKSDFSTNARLTRGEAQTHAGANETSTASYLLLNLGAQYHIASVADADIMVFANAKNLLNENIRNSTSYLRNFAPDAGRSGEVGIRVSY
ncbi:MAG: iron complex outermembrane recepter protein [Methylococcaceae bacterium NSP1-2]|nr:TonB-dependent receptor [Methylococcaceae bacterium]OYV19101.1 MAG: iron complex outermembrane recepter protein [Methylococcaceae bacterium NSP1-2]